MARAGCLNHKTPSKVHLIEGQHGIDKTSIRIVKSVDREYNRGKWS